MRDGARCRQSDVARRAWGTLPQGNICQGDLPEVDLLGHERLVEQARGSVRVRMLLVSLFAWGSIDRMIDSQVYRQVRKLCQGLARQGKAGRVSRCC
mmetsp:Transcript_32925/g.52612  ORF Transcript_32925/g.52612 Transcript_32925/m.52612 type:complete len:97 (+) Transcript_32925:2211-2501(+)